MALFSTPRERDAVWGLRESGLGSGAPREGVPRGWPGAEDFAVHPNRLGEYLRRFDQLLRRHCLTVNMHQGHFGEGCVHGRVAFDFSTPEGVETFRRALHRNERADRRVRRLELRRARRRPRTLRAAA